MRVSICSSFRCRKRWPSECAESPSLERCSRARPPARSASRCSVRSVRLTTITFARCICRTSRAGRAPSPDGQSLVFSMQGSLWKQHLGTAVAEQLTAGPGYDFQPDWSPDGKRIAFVRYAGDAMELAQLDLV